MRRSMTSIRSRLAIVLSAVMVFSCVPVNAAEFFEENVTACEDGCEVFDDSTDSAGETMADGAEVTEAAGLTVITKTDGALQFLAEDYKSHVYEIPGYTDYLNSRVRFIIPEDYKYDSSGNERTAAVSENKSLSSDKVYRWGVKVTAKEPYFIFKTDGPTKITACWSASGEDSKAITVNKDGEKLTTTNPGSKDRTDQVESVATTDAGGVFTLGYTGMYLYWLKIEVTDTQSEVVDTSYKSGDIASLKTITDKAVFTVQDDMTERMLQADGNTLALYRTLMAGGQLAFFAKREQADETKMDTTTKIDSKLVSRGSDEKNKEPVAFETGESYLRALSTQGGWYESKKGRLSAAFNFRTGGKAVVKVYWGSNNDEDTYLGVFRSAALSDSDPENHADALAVAKDVHSKKHTAKISTFELPEADEYFLGGYKKDGQGKNAQIYKIEITVEMPEEYKGEGVSPMDSSKSGADLAKELEKGKEASGSAHVWTASGDSVDVIMDYAKGKVKAVSMGEVKSAGSVNKLTVNAGIKLSGLSGYTVSANTSDEKVKKIADKAAKSVAKSGVATLKAVKGVPIYKLVLTGADGKIVELTVVNICLDKRIKKNLSLTSEAVPADQLKNYRQNIDSTYGVVSGNCATVGTTMVSGGRHANRRFSGGVWTVGNTIITQVGEPVSVSIGKLSVNAMVNNDGTITVAPAGGKGTIKLTYTLGGKKYSTAVKVK